VRAKADIDWGNAMPRFGRPLTVGLLGSYGGLNLGDEAILTSMLPCLHRMHPSADVVVFSRHPRHTRANHGSTTVVGWEGVPREDTSNVLQQLDLLVVGGGGLICNSEARRYLRLVQAAQEVGVPTFGFALGAGPLTDPEDCGAVVEVMDRMDQITVRDEHSKVVLEEVGVRHDIEVTADPALLLEPEPFTEDMLLCEGVPSGVRLIGMSAREPGAASDQLDQEGYHELLAVAADFLINRLDAHVLFIPMERDDIRHSHEVLSYMANADRARVLNGPYRPTEILGLMNHLDLVIGMRLHFLIFAAMTGVPLLPLPCAKKVCSFAQAVGAPVLTGVMREGAGPLLAEVDRLWDHRHAHADSIRHRVDHLRERARVTGRLCGDLIDRIWQREGTPDGTIGVASA
jgi:polysaccharide pyruvyl transferase CsaB